MTPGGLARVTPGGFARVTPRGGVTTVFFVMLLAGAAAVPGQGAPVLRRAAAFVRG
jgi:hypothetical protein